MARTQGLTPFSANFELQKRAALDARSSVETQADLLLPATWLALDGNEYTYLGMSVSVFNDGTNNGIYVLIGTDYTDIANWLLVGSSNNIDLVDNWVSKFQVTSDFAAGEVIDLTTGDGSATGTCNLFSDNIDGIDRVIGASAGGFFQDAGMNVYIQGQGELYKSVGVIYDSPTSLHFPIPLQVGDFFWVEKDAGMGISGGGWASATTGTHAEIKALKDAASLVPGEWYEITDYQTAHVIPGTTDINIGPIENLILEATSSDTFRDVCLSKTEKDDEVYYNIDNLSITSDGTLAGEWDTGSDQGGDITLNVTGPRTFTVNKEPVIDNDFYGYCEDDNGNDFDIEIFDYGTLWNVNDLGGGLWEIVIDNSVTIDLTTVGYNWIEIEYKEVLGSRKGWITKRTYKPNNVSAPFDFRNVKMRLYKLDLTGSAWNSGTTYSYRNLVEYNGDVYISASNNNVGVTPSGTYNKRWIRVLQNADTEYLVTYKGLDFYGTINADLTDYVEIGMFTVKDGTNFVDGLDKFSNVESDYSYYEVNNIMFITSTYGDCRSFNIHKESRNSIFFRNVQDTNFNRVYECIFINGIVGCTFNRMDKVVARYLSSVRIGGSVNSLVVASSITDSIIDKSMYSCMFGGSCYGNKIYQLSSCSFTNAFYSNTLKQYSSYCYILGSNFYRNEIGSMNSITYDLPNYDFRDNVIGINFRANSFNGYFRENHVGDYFQYNDFLTHCHMNNIGNYFAGQNNTTRNQLGNTLRNDIGDNFGRYGRNIVLGTFDRNTIVTDQRDWNISSQCISNVIQSSVQGVTLDYFQNNTVTGMLTSVTLHRLDDNTITGWLRSMNSAGMEFHNNLVAGQVYGCTIQGTCSRNNFIAGNQTNSCQLGASFTGNTVSGLVNCNFDTTAGTFVQRNQFINVPNGTNFTSATHVYELYDCKLTFRDGNIGMLQYIDSSGNLQIVAATS